MKGFNKYNLPPWLRNFRDVLKQFIVPFCVFQGVRTFFFPSVIDLFVLILLLIVAAAYHNEII